MDNSPWLTAIRRLFSSEVFEQVRLMAETQGAAVALDWVEQQVRSWRHSRASLMRQGVAA